MRIAHSLPRSLASLTFVLLASCSGSSGDTTPGDDAGGGDDTAKGDTITSGDTNGIDTATGADTATGGDTTGVDTATGSDTTGTDTTGTDTKPATGAIKTFFVILMENHNWSAIKGSASAPYLNGTMLKNGAHAEQYYNPPGLHPSEPNYIWLEAGDNLGITDDNDPGGSGGNHQSTTDHLVTQLQAKGISWKSYQEDIDGKTCPLSSVKQYAPKHNPMVYFDDVTDTNKTTSANCIAHVRPYTELATDLTAGKQGRYNFLTPNLCNDMHGPCPGNVIKAGDDWLAAQIPVIQASAAYKDGGVILVVWDEAGSGDGPIGAIVLSPLAKVGYSSTVKYTHSSTLRTVEEVFGVPFLRDAAKATNLADLFTSYP